MVQAIRMPATVGENSDVLPPGVRRDARVYGLWSYAIRLRPCVTCTFPPPHVSSSAATAPVTGDGPRRNGDHVARKDFRLSGQARRPGGPDRLHPRGE